MLSHPRSVLVAQLDRASASEAEGCRFDSCRGHLETKDLRRIEKTVFRRGTKSGTEELLGLSGTFSRQTFRLAE